MTFNITGYSTALFATWFFIEELGILFDAGDGVSASLLQKSRKIKQVFISHADRDHLNGLPQFYQLNARKDYPKIYYPNNCGSFPALQAFLKKFDPHLVGSEWLPIKEGTDFKVKGDIFVKAIRNGHVLAADGLTKSLSYKVIQKKRKIKEEFLQLSGKEIAAIVKEKGRDFISNEVSEELLGYSGDTPVEDYERWVNTKTLIHEATFLNHEAGTNTKANKHSNLAEVIKMVAELHIERLILSHFSSRYSKEAIDKAILGYCKEYKIAIPVYRLLPGEVCRDILSREPLNK